MGLETLQANNTCSTDSSCLANCSFAMGPAFLEPFKQNNMYNMQSLCISCYQMGFESFKS